MVFPAVELDHELRGGPERVDLVTEDEDERGCRAPARIRRSGSPAASGLRPARRARPAAGGRDVAPGARGHARKSLPARAAATGCVDPPLRPPSSTLRMAPLRRSRRACGRPSSPESPHGSSLPPPAACSGGSKCLAAVGFPVARSGQSRESVPFGGGGAPRGRSRSDDSKQHRVHTPAPPPTNSPAVGRGYVRLRRCCGVPQQVVPRQVASQPKGC